MKMEKGKTKLCVRILFFKLLMIKDGKQNYDFMI